MTMVAPRPPMSYEVLGRGEGSAGGLLIIDYPTLPVLMFIPIKLNTRTERAYRDAVESVGGATGLINVSIRESWTWWVFGSTRSVTVIGDAIKESN